MEDMITEVSKPSDWPANAKECALENIHNAVLRFIENPGYETREVLVSLVSHYDLNQRSYLGLYRVTEYEVSMINSLYMYAGLIQFNTLKVYLYEIVGDTTRMQKMVSKMMPDESLDIEQYQYLFYPLKLYYITYQQFTVLNNRYFADQLIDVVNQLLLEENSPENIFYLTRSYVAMLNDLSYFRCKKRTGIWAFSREDLLKLFRLEAKLVKMNNQSAIVRPLKGVLMTTISNYILKSRNSYNSDYICKYISKEVARSSTRNREIWMQKIKYLNDRRELRVVPELFANKQWLNYEWAKNIDFKPVRDYYVSSFCKTINNTDMKGKYGQCIYGYKDDRIAELLAPIGIRKNGDKQYPFFSQVISFDIIYDVQEAKDEVNYLSSIIDMFDLIQQEKKKFLEQILQYWILSVKDKKWSYERERRYVLFLYDDYNYIELDKSDERFLKLTTSLLVLPDFVLGDNPSKLYLRTMIDNKRGVLSTKDYMFCSDCLSCEFDAIHSKNEQCPICGSNEFYKVNATGKAKRF